MKQKFDKKKNPSRVLSTCVITSWLFFCRDEISLSRYAIAEKRKDFHELAIMKLRDARRRVRTNDLTSVFEGFSRKNGTGIVRFRARFLKIYEKLVDSLQENITLRRILKYILNRKKVLHSTRFIVNIFLCPLPFTPLLFSRFNHRK